MKQEYELKNMKKRKNPYINQLKEQITIRIDKDTISYFKELSEQNGLPYQSLINLYLRDCAKKNKKLEISWA